MVVVVEHNKKIQLDFAGPLPDDNEVYILVAVDVFRVFLTKKVVTNNKADTII